MPSDTDADGAIDSLKTDINNDGSNDSAGDRLADVRIRDRNDDYDNEDNDWREETARGPGELPGGFDNSTGVSPGPARSPSSAPSVGFVSSVADALVEVHRFRGSTQTSAAHRIPLRFGCAVLLLSTAGLLPALGCSIEGSECTSDADCKRRGEVCVENGGLFTRAGRCMRTKPRDAVSTHEDADAIGCGPDLAKLGRHCTVGTGACSRAGVIVCLDEQMRLGCKASPGEPQTEVQDGADNDCDGAIDEADADIDRRAD